MSDIDRWQDYCDAATADVLVKLHGCDSTSAAIIAMDAADFEVAKRIARAFKDKSGCEPVMTLWHQMAGGVEDDDFEGYRKVEL